MKLRHWFISAALATSAYPTAAGATTVTTLHEFQASDGYALDAGLVRSPDGTLYGTTSADLGPKGAGVIYQLKPDGLGAYQYSVIYRFCAKKRCSDGAGPAPGARLALRQGRLYGTTMGGGIGYGVAYELAPDTVTGAWKLTVLHAFDGPNERAVPIERASLAFGPDGTLYGVGGTWNEYSGGIVYALIPASKGAHKRSLQIIHTFS